ncbi:alkylhydroperoxidase AhpD family core domain-containing protein [Micromonospora phaseoli]|uniref:Alkylhydroperoxidase AhpD family core domain-containing protein n=1 Tax=Micromonospora phaseoli TaxID=1144548 RepID=A0A1H7BVV0_9ACTN|nr:carboxymuconolactone decarboxylase family protein [Micromonospora phaseoli]PZV92791.1 AhpD family alkylhydroperoxidase [Micromonospora phaseoli]SEJ81783.1 alkylhydroperoxidase AhpD family core domain-containing protein [Micromonospora phaseoli]
MGILLARLTNRVTQGHIEHLRPVPARTAPPLVRRVYRQLAREFGLLAPPITLHAAAPPVLGACWLMLREALLCDGPVDRDTKEAVAAAVSLANRCPYCVQVHGSALRGLLRGPDSAAVADDRIAEIAEPRLREIAAFFRHGGAGPPVTTARLDATELAHLVGVAVLFHYLNRMVNVFVAPSPLPAVPSPAAGAVRWLAAVMMGRLARRGGAPGRQLDLLPPAAPPPDLSWARPDPTLHAAFARAYAAIDGAAEPAVPSSVRRLLPELLAGQRTITDPGEVEAALDGLPVRDRSAGRLALTIAFFSYRVTDPMVASYRRYDPADRRLLELAAWASLTAARAAGPELHSAWHDPPPA